MKKLLYLSALVFCFTFVSCGDDDNDDDGSVCLKCTAVVEDDGFVSTKAIDICEGDVEDGMTITRADLEIERDFPEIAGSDCTLN